MVRVEGLLFLYVVLGAVLPADAALSAQERPRTEIVTQIPHSDNVNSVAFSPDGRQVLSGSDDTTVKLWDASTGVLVRTFAGHSGSARSVAFSPDGALVLAGDYTTIKLWDARTGVLIRNFDGHSDAVSSVSFAPDGKQVLSASWDKTIKLWDVGTGALLHTFTGHSADVTSVAFSPDGKQILSGSKDKTIKLWDARTGALKWLADKVRINAGRDTLVRTFAGHSASVTSVAFSPDGRQVLSGSDDSTIRLWDANTSALVRTFVGQSDLVFSIAVSADGTQVLSGSFDGKVNLWDATTGLLVRMIHGHSSPVTSVAFSTHGGHVLSGSYDRTIRLWDMGTGSLVRTFAGHSEPVTTISVSPKGGQALAGSWDKTIKLWDTGTGALIRTFSGHSANVTSVTFSPDGKQVLSGSSDKTIKLWDAGTGALVRTIAGHSRSVTSVAFSPDGGKVLSASWDNTIKLWDVGTGVLLRTFKGHSDVVTSVAFSSEGRRVLSASGDSTIRLWDAGTGALVRTFTGHYGAVDSVTFSPDSRQVLSGGGVDETIKLWDAGTGALIRTFTGHSANVTSVAFSPDGKQVLSGSGDKTIKLWDADTGALVQTFEDHSARVSSVAFSPDGKSMLSGGEDTVVRIRDAATGRSLATLLATSERNWLAITPDGFFAGSLRGSEVLSIVRGLQVTTIAQVHQSLFNPDLVLEALAGDPSGEVKRAAEVINLEKVLDSGPAPEVLLTSPPPGGTSNNDLITVNARLRDRGKGIGRIEWRVNGITVGVCHAPGCLGPDNEVKQQIALDPGENRIEVVAYNTRDILPSLPAQVKITLTGPADGTKPKLHILAIGINKYADKGWVAPGNSAPFFFPKLDLAVNDARALAAELKKAGTGLYNDVRIRTALDEEATAANLDAIVTEFAAGIGPRDTFVLFAAAHGYSNEGHFFLIPQDYQGGPNPEALKVRAIGQAKLQDWVANRVKAKKALILLDTCESGALTSGYLHSRIDGPASEAGVGRLHEATGRPVLTAAARGQSALEYQDIKHGIFTAALIDGLRHAQADQRGVIMLTSLVAYVQDLVPKLVKDPSEREALLKRGIAGSAQSVRFGSRGEDFAIFRRLR